MSYGTGTQVDAQMINKCRVIIVGRMLYKRRKSPWPGDRKKEEENGGEREKRSWRNKAYDTAPRTVIPGSLKEYPHVHMVAWLAYNYVHSFKT